MACYVDAINAYLRRHKTDTNPRIMEALTPSGASDDHWYYMSDEVIFTSRFILDEELRDEYEGPLSEMPSDVRLYFSRGIPYDFGTRAAQLLAQNGFRTYEECEQRIVSAIRW